MPKRFAGMSEVIDNAADSRFELATPDGPAIAVYEREGDIVVFVHTEVPSGERGHGIGDRLIAGALAQVRARGERIVPACPFVADYIERHPEERDLVAT